MTCPAAKTINLKPNLKGGTVLYGLPLHIHISFCPLFNGIISLNKKMNPDMLLGLKTMGMVLAV